MLRPSGVEARILRMGGLEDNPSYDAERTRPATNPGLVARVAELAAIAGRPLATAAEVRKRLRLS